MGSSGKEFLQKGERPELLSWIVQAHGNIMQAGRQSAAHKVCSIEAAASSSASAEDAAQAISSKPPRSSSPYCFPSTTSSASPTEASVRQSLNGSECSICI